MFTAKTVNSLKNSRLLPENIFTIVFVGYYCFQMMFFGTSLFPREFISRMLAVFLYERTDINESN